MANLFWKANLFDIKLLQRWVEHLARDRILENVLPIRLAEVVEREVLRAALDRWAWSMQLRRRGQVRINLGQGALHNGVEIGCSAVNHTAEHHKPLFWRRLATKLSPLYVPACAPRSSQITISYNERRDALAPLIQREFSPSCLCFHD